MYPTINVFGGNYPAYMANNTQNNNSYDAVKSKTETEPTQPTDRFEKSQSPSSSQPLGYMTPFGMQLYGQPRLGPRSI